MAEALIDMGGLSVGPEVLTIPRARETAAVLGRGILDYARLVGCRRREEGREEILLLELEIERPQVRVHNVWATEPVAVVFHSDDRRPDVVSLRPDFPHVPHLNLSRTEHPKNLCLYEKDWLEVRVRWTAARFLERIRFWFAKTARGALHQDDQPLEPLITSTGYQIIVPHDLDERVEAGGIVALSVTLAESKTSKVLIARLRTGEEARGVPFLAAAVSAQPQPHGVIRRSPTNLFELHQFVRGAGCDLLAALRASDELWAKRENLTARFIIITICPKTRGGQTTVEATDIWAFMTLQTVEEVLAAIGRRDRGGGVIMGGPRDEEQGQAIELDVLRTVFGLSRDTAAILSGRQRATDTRIVAVGLGALGSKVQLSLARSGFGLWTLVDDDVLLPHNLPRHQYAGFWLGYRKAVIAQAATQSLFEGETAPELIAANVLRPGEDGARLDEALAQAQVILDMSASVTVARHLALGVQSTARRLSVFLNPAGADIVLLAEDAGRTVTLDSLEFQLYREILANPALAAHLTETIGRIRYSGSCRDVTSRVPDDRISILAAIASHAVRQALDHAQSVIRVWKLDPASFQVTSHDVTPRRITATPQLNWTVVVDDGLVEKLQALRRAKLPNETGGILLGFFDHDQRRVYVVDTIPSPPDSEEWPTLYIRGSISLQDDLKRVTRLTGGNLEYVGEWHSHPVGCSCRPSRDDEKVFAWLTRHMDEEGQPALMAIVGDRGPHVFLGTLLWNDR